MVSSEEVLERSFYMSLLKTTLANGFTLDPEEFLPPSPANEARFEEEKKKLKKFIYIFGVGNSQSRGQKTLPRITLEVQGYYPGSIGIEKFQIDSTDKLQPRLVESEFSTKDVVVDVHLVASNQTDMRLLHSLMYHSLPATGYIKPYYNNYGEYLKDNQMNPSGNIFIEIGNYYDHSDTDHGILEKVYSYTVKDGFVMEDIHEAGELVPIKDISLLIHDENATDMKVDIKSSNNT